VLQPPTDLPRCSSVRSRRDFPRTAPVLLRAYAAGLPDAARPTSGRRAYLSQMRASWSTATSAARPRRGSFCGSSTAASARMNEGQDLGDAAQCLALHGWREVSDRARERRGCEEGARAAFGPFHWPELFKGAHAVLRNLRGTASGGKPLSVYHLQDA
jgi:hypothetical protein